MAPLDNKLHGAHSGGLNDFGPPSATIIAESTIRNSAPMISSVIPTAKKNERHMI